MSLILPGERFGQRPNQQRFLQEYKATGFEVNAYNEAVIWLDSLLTQLHFPEAKDVTQNTSPHTGQKQTEVTFPAGDVVPTYIQVPERLVPLDHRGRVTHIIYSRSESAQV